MHVAGERDYLLLIADKLIFQAVYLRLDVFQDVVVLVVLSVL